MIQKLKEKQRTLSQNDSLHMYCTQLAQLLNESGIPQSVFYADLEADYSRESIKELFRSYGRTQYQKTSTAQLSTKQISNIYEEINRHTSKFGIHIPWPSQEGLANQQHENRSNNFN